MTGTLRLRHLTKNLFGTHADYLRGLEVAGGCAGYNTDPLDGFRRLALDLAGAIAGSGMGLQWIDRCPANSAHPGDKRLP